MSAFDRRYEPDAIEAVLYAYLDRKQRPLRKVLEMGRLGQLRTRDGREVRPFDCNEDTMRGYLTRERKRRRGAPRGSALDRPDDVLEGLRKRMIAVADQELTFVERQKRGKRDPEHLRQIARVLREVAALPKPGEGRGRQPGKRDHNGVMVDGQTEGGIAGKLLAAHRRAPAPEPLNAEETKAENTDNGAHARINAHDSGDEPEPTGQGAEPGSSQRGAARLVPSPARTPAA